MKSLVLPLALCAALGGCASYDTAGYASPAGYPYGVYANYPDYAYGWPYAGPLYGGPAVDFSFYGPRVEHRGDHRWRDRGEPGTHVLGAGPNTRAMGAGPNRMHGHGGLGHRPR
jgi:hypothetical protein